MLVKLSGGFDPIGLSYEEHSCQADGQDGDKVDQHEVANVDECLLDQRNVECCLLEDLHPLEQFDHEA